MLLCQLTFIFLLAPRGADSEAPTLRLDLPRVLKLDAGPLLVAGVYELDWTGTELVATSTNTRQEAFRLRLAPKSTPEGPRAVALTIDRKTARATLQVRLGKEEITLLGTVGDGPGSAVGLGDGGPVSLPVSMPTTTDDPVQNVWNTRFRPQVDHCVDRAQRWALPKYEKCVCPIVTKLRMPPLPGVHVLPIDARHQVTLELDKKGAVKSCSLK